MIKLIFNCYFWPITFLFLKFFVASSLFSLIIIHRNLMLSKICDGDFVCQNVTQEKYEGNIIIIDVCTHLLYPVICLQIRGFFVCL